MDDRRAVRDVIADGGVGWSATSQGDRLRRGRVMMAPARPRHDAPARATTGHGSGPTRNSARKKVDLGTVGTIENPHGPSHIPTLDEHLRGAAAAMATTGTAS